MTVAQWYAYLEDRMPLSLREEWDNDGLMCSPDTGAEVHKILLSLDVTVGAVEVAAERGYDLILSHHPLVFHPLHSVTDSRLVKCLQKGISVFSFHTRLDRVSGGVNDVLAQKMGLMHIRPFGDGMGRMGEFSAPLSPRELAQRVHEVLGTPAVCYAGKEQPVTTLAVLGGSGGDMTEQALQAGAQAYLSGEFAHHHFTDAERQGILLVQGGHFYTENPVLEALERMLKEADGNVTVGQFRSDTVQTVMG